MEKDIIDLDQEYIMHSYKRNNVAFKYGKNACLYDYNDKKYIDFTSGIGVNALGYQDPDWIDAVVNQVKTLAHTSNLYYTMPDAKLAEMICKRTKMSKVFFANSGAEANEGMIKAMRKYSYEKYGEKRNVIITLNKSFHGRTITTLKATGQEKFHTYFMPFTEGFRYADKNIESVKELNADGACCGVIIETIQGEGGVLPLEESFILDLYNYCKENDILFGVDEVQTGNGRTGYLYSYQRYGITPDIFSTAKGLAGGLPIGAVVFSSKLENIFPYGTHGSTFGGNPICASAGVATLEKIDDKLLKHVLEMEKLVRSTLDMKGVSITGHGLMLGIEVEGKNNVDILNKCLEKGLLVLTAGTKTRLLPPLTISKEEMLEGLEILKGVILE